MEIKYETLKDRTKKRIIDDMIRSVRTGSGWKVVVVDPTTLRIISAACRMFDITEEGVSLVENLSVKRQPLPTMDALYFISPTPESIEMLINDFKNAKEPQYAHAHLFFTKRVPDEELRKIKASNLLSKIKTLKEINIDFLAYESNVFHFDDPGAFHTLYSPEVNNRGVQFKAISEKLASVCATLGDYPLIRYSINKETNSFTQTIATLLQERLDDLMRNSPDYANTANIAHNRATLLILDRSYDPVSPLLHEFTYQAMVYDLLNVDNDRYKYNTTTNEGSARTKEILLNEADPLWPVLRHMHIAETMNWILDNFNAFLKENKASNLTSKKVQSLKDMAEAMKSMPQYQEMLGKYSLHINMASSAMDEFNKKNLAKLAGAEQDMATGEDAEGKTVKNLMSNVAPLLSDPSVDVFDKLRLIMLYIISQEGIKDADRRRVMDLAKISFEDQACITNLRYLGVTLMKATRGSRKKSSKDKKSKNRDDAPSYDLSRYNPALKDIATAVIENSLSATEFPYTKEPISFNDDKPGNRGSAVAPTSLRKTKVANIERKSEKVAVTGGRIIIFVAGGMTCSEMRVCYELTRKFNREVIIGGTHIFTPKKFIESLRGLMKLEKAEVTD